MSQYSATAIFLAQPATVIIISAQALMRTPDFTHMVEGAPYVISLSLDAPAALDHPEGNQLDERSDQRTRDRL
jgi:hypothetical protein